MWLVGLSRDQRRELYMLLDEIVREATRDLRMLAAAAKGCCCRDTWRGCFQTCPRAKSSGGAEGTRSRTRAPRFPLGITQTGEYRRGTGSGLKPSYCFFSSAGSPPAKHGRKEGLEKCSHS